jgi:hypothetical protein
LMMELAKKRKVSKHWPTRTWCFLKNLCECTNTWCKETN